MYNLHNVNVFELNILLCIYTSISQNQFNLNSHIKHLLLQKLNLVIEHDYEKAHLRSDL